MTDDASKKSAVPDDPVADDAFASLTSYRRLGQTFIAALAGIPAVTLLSSIVRAPGENGFYEHWLLAGLALVAAALCLGVWLVAWIRAPIDLRDNDPRLQSFDMSRIIGASVFPDYQSVLDQIGRITRSPDVSAQSEKALEADLRIRQRAYQLVAADQLRDRVTGDKAKALFGFSLLFATLGVFYLAIAPKPKPAASEAAAVQLVSVRLTSNGQMALGCESATFTALQVGGDSTSPIVVPSDTTCTAGDVLTLTVGAEEKLASSVQPIKAVVETTDTDATDTTDMDTG